MYVNCTWIHLRYTCKRNKTWNLSWCLTYCMDIKYICITVFCFFGICITSHSIQQCNYLERWYIVFINRSLSSNQISQIDNNVFQGLSQLTTLWVKTKSLFFVTSCFEHFTNGRIFFLRCIEMFPIIFVIFWFRIYKGYIHVLLVSCVEQFFF